MSLNLTSTLLVEQVLFGARRLGRSRHSSVDTGEALFYLLIAAGVIAAVCAAVYIGSRILHKRRFNSHASLFSSLCQTHRLSHSERALLKSVASQHRLSQPARVFTEPQWLDPTNLSGALSRQAAQLSDLRNRLFATTDR